MVTKKNAENSLKFICENCDFKCSKKSNYDKHLTTQKHLTNYNCLQSIYKKMPEMPKKYNCPCGKEYIHRQGLYAHKKKCSGNFIIKKEYDINSLEVSHLTNLVIELVNTNKEIQKQNQEFKKEILDLYKTTGVTNNTHNTHNNNKTFNMQFFLNETCKDAMNIMDFVNSMTLEFSDLEEVGKVGYVEGISNIIIRKLNALDIHKRPIHCSDAKREIMYVKDENVWEKENSTYDKLRKAIKHVTCKNSSLLGPWSKEHPQCMNNQHHLNDVYVQMMGQSMGGKESFVDSENKIMKKIAKAVFINKE
jgi:hypothetical protein